MIFGIPSPHPPTPPSAETRGSTAGAEHDNNQKNDSKHKNKMLRDIQEQYTLIL